jgi:hypothetical protein
VHDDADIDDLVDHNQYCQEHLYTEENRTHTISLIQAKRDNNGDLDVHIPAADVDSADVEYDEPLPLRLPFPSVLTSSLTDEQQRVFQDITLNPCGLHIISGYPGSGKSHLTKSS